MFASVSRRRVYAIVAVAVFLTICGHTYITTSGSGLYDDAYNRFAENLPSLSRGSSLVYHERVGLAKVDRANLGMHPVRELMERAERLHQQQQEKVASFTSLEDAVEDYREAFGMEPPRGFDTWYQWTVDNGALPVPSMLGQAVRPNIPFLAYPPEILRERLYNDQHEAFAFCVVFQREEGDVVLNVTTPQVHKRKYWSPGAVKELWEPLLPFVPKPFDEDPDTFMIFGWEDGPIRVVSHEILEKSQQLAEKGLMWDPKYLYEEERKSLWRYGWAQMCPPSSPFRQKPIIKMQQDMKVMYPHRADVVHADKTFIYDNQACMDWCENPLLTQLSSTLVQDYWRRSGQMSPTFGQSRLHNSPELTWSPTMAFKQSAPESVWEDKTIGKMLWRGSPNGMLHANTTAWRSQQRHRITNLFNYPTGTRKLIVEKSDYLRSQSSEIQEFETSTLVEQYMNVSFTGQKGKPYFCWHDGTCAELDNTLIYRPRIEPDEAIKFRYILDIDGHGWSSRFRRELTTGSVLMKATVHPEWFYDIIIPWYHYVPLQMDYSDLFDILSFFEGAPGSSSNNLDMAKKIGDRGKLFTKERWRLEDMQSFSLLQILEYQRIWASDRKKATYRV